jgi:ribosomal protein S18 acetylase RimI-like enzyme
MLAGAVIAWARSQGATQLGLWVPADNGRAQAFYQRQGFAGTGRDRPFPGHSGRSISEMRLDLGGTGSAALMGQAGYVADSSVSVISSQCFGTMRWPSPG